jgi:hypothetical protein
MGCLLAGAFRFTQWPQVSQYIPPRLGCQHFVISTSSGVEKWPHVRGMYDQREAGSRFAAAFLCEVPRRGGATPKFVGVIGPAEPFGAVDSDVKFPGDPLSVFVGFWPGE